ncbi:STAS domain-containing protein [Streptomyces pratensis]|uniref:STAS domain-containing protein n=1 Tax=Streptomyces pratensis TaxID=1169025 RepID=UPI0037889E96
MQPFTLHFQVCGDLVLVTPRGSMDRIGDAAVDGLLALFGTGVRAVVLDMGRVPRMGVAGLGLLDRLLAYGSEHDAHVVSVGWRAQPRHVLGPRIDCFVPPPRAVGNAVVGGVERAVQARALKALARGASFGAQLDPRDW